MSDYRKLEIIINVVGLIENAMTKEPGNKIVPIRSFILVDENTSVEAVAERFVKAIVDIEQEM